MKNFKYKNSILFWGEQNLLNIAHKYPTPFYLYDLSLIRQNFLRLKNAFVDFGGRSIEIAYAVKANNNPQVLNTLAQLGSGADVVSMGELKLAVEAKIPLSKIVFSGVGKSSEELNFAIQNKIKSINVESIEEALEIIAISEKSKSLVNIAFRLNPEVEALTHKYISTGSKSHKFGVLKADIIKFHAKYFNHPFTKIIGLSVHIGSQLTSFKATQLALMELCSLATQIELKQKKALSFLDIGGGLGICYTATDESKLLTVEKYAFKVNQVLSKYYFNHQHPSHKIERKDTQILTEPGRIIVGNAGIIVSKVIRTKLSDKIHFTIIDAGMNDLIRPALYHAHHEMLAINKNTKKKKLITNVVGPICESSDLFLKDFSFDSNILKDDFICIKNAGAYGHTMASTYNQRPLIKEFCL